MKFFFWKANRATFKWLCLKCHISASWKPISSKKSSLDSSWVNLLMYEKGARRWASDEILLWSKLFWDSLCTCIMFHANKHISWGISSLKGQPTSIWFVTVAVDFLRNWIIYKYTDNSNIFRFREYVYSSAGFQKKACF